MIRKREIVLIALIRLRNDGFPDYWAFAVYAPAEFATNLVQERFIEADVGELRKIGDPYILIHSEID